MLQRIQLCARANLKWPLCRLYLLVSIIFVCWLTESVTRAAAEPREPIAPIPLAPDLDPQRVALGERFFYDVRLSHDHPNYDSLPRTGQNLSRALGLLRTESATVSGHAAQEIRQHVEALAAALYEKLTLVEYVTSDNALLRNSVMYITYTGQTLSARGAAEKAMATDIATVSHALLRFLQTPEHHIGIEAEAALERLAHPSPFQQDLDPLAAHGRLIVEVLPQVDALLRRIIAAPTAAHAEALQDAVLQYASRVEARAQVFRVLLYLVAVILLGYLLYQFVRLRANAWDLRRVNTDLQREMRERRQAVAALRASEERFRTITESANDAIISADSAGNVVSWNARAEAIFGYPTENILGTPLTRLMPTGYHTAHVQRFTQWSATGATRLVGTTAEFSGLRKDGSEFPLDISLRLRKR